jgi:hypothetical protein
VALLPTQIPASREPGLRLNPPLRRIPAEVRAELTSAEIAMRGSYFDDVLRDPRRYGIENTTDKERRPGAVRHDATPCASSVLFECKSKEERVVYKELNSTETLIQRTTMEAPQQTYGLHRARRSQEDDQLLR